MTNGSETLRSCPTRADGAEVLIAHSISIEICQERQRRLYHKCFTCAHCGKGAHERAPELPPGSPRQRGPASTYGHEEALIRAPAKTKA